jgi:hypothetical protein
MTPRDYMAYWLLTLVVLGMVHAALTSAPGSLMARALEAIARYFGWTK